MTVSKTGPRRVVVGVDIGGTFTDLVVKAGQGRAPATHKILTTSRDPAKAVIQGVRDLVAGQGLALRDVTLLVHGTTLATNALIERKGAKTALLTTEGFRDVLQTGTELRYDLYDLFIELNGTPQHPKRTVILRAGDVLTFRTPGGGGYGDPREPSPDRL